MNKDLVRKNPYSTAYDLYGDPHKLVEFRLMVLNHCSMNCRGCFYKRDNNNFNDFNSALGLAESMIKNDYKMETCYLLPTDIFDNKDNYNLFKNKEFSKIISLFSYVGIASTLEDDYDEKFFDIIFDNNKIYKTNTKVELQVNLSIKRIFEKKYEDILERNIRELKNRYKKDIVINLAINTGFNLSVGEKKKLKELLSKLSEDGIIELNFTFLYNDLIPFEKKKSMLRRSIHTVNEFGDYYSKDKSFNKRYNDRTFLRKPSFAFIGDPNRIYVNPIVPFDEYVFAKDEKFLVKNPTFEGFLESYGNLSLINSTVIDDCENCDNLKHCMGKYYFSIANHFDLGCFMKLINEE